MFLISDPNGTLIGARATRAGANQLIEEHAMTKMREEASDQGGNSVDHEDGPRLYALHLADYKLEEVFPSIPQEGTTDQQRGQGDV